MYFPITRKWKLQMLLTIIGMVTRVPFPNTQLTKSDISPMQLAFINATVENGFKEVKDFNAGEQHGVGPYPTNIVDGHRMNTGMKY